MLCQNKCHFCLGPSKFTTIGVEGNVVVIITCAYVTSKVELEANGSKYVGDIEDVFKDG